MANHNTKLKHGDPVALERKHKARQKAARAHVNYLAETNLGAQKPKFIRHDRFIMDDPETKTGRIVPGGFPAPDGAVLKTPKALGFKPPSIKPPIPARSARAAIARQLKTKATKKRTAA